MSSEFLRIQKRQLRFWNEITGKAAIRAVDQSRKISFWKALESIIWLEDIFIVYTVQNTPKSYDPRDTAPKYPTTIGLWPISSRREPLHACIQSVLNERVWMTILVLIRLQIFTAIRKYFLQKRWTLAGAAWGPGQTYCWV